MSYLQGPFYIKFSVRHALYLLGICVLSLAPLFSHAQDDLNIHGVVSDAMTSSKLDGVTVNVIKNGTQHDSFTTRANGKYEFYLDCDSRYELVFNKDGYVERSIIIDAKNVPQEVIGAGIIMPTDMSMYEITEAMEDADLSVFNQPIGKAKFDPGEGDLVWDFSYTNKVKGDIMSFMRDVEKKQKELDKQASEAEKAAAEAEEKFNTFVKDGDDAMSDDEYQDAVLNYQAALEIKPDALKVKQKLGDAQTKWNNQKAAAEREENYAAALDAGDGFMRTEEYNKAVESYQSALEIKPEEAYPEEQIVEAQRIIKEREENLANQEKFNALMAEAETAFDAKEFENALAKYEEAQAVFPDNKEVADKIEVTKVAIANKEKMAKLQADYDALIASADEKFDAGNFEASISDYEAASDLLPEETYPPERIAAAQAKIEAKAEAAANQAEFDELMKAGNEALTATNYAGALEKFNAALEIFPDDDTAKAKKEEAQNLLNEKNAAAEKQTNYDALIAAADDLFGDENYADAKAKYQEAKELIPEETYPLDQITKINALLKEKAEAEEAQNAYDEAMAAGATAQSEKNYSEAISRYEEALGIFPDDEAAKEALENAKASKTEYEKNQATQEEYDALISSADEKFGNEKYDEARSDYQAALEVMPDEEYPQSQLELIETAIAEREKEAAAAKEAAELQAAYEGFMTAGDEAMAASEYEEAISQYDEALGLKEGDETATAKRKDARRKLNELQSQKELDEQYTAKITLADEKLSDEALEEALTAYRDAADLKPTEQYPKDQIALVEEKIAAKEAAAKEAEMQAKTEEVNALVLEADKLVEEKNFQTGIVKYEEALGILPDRSDIQAKKEAAMKAMLAFQEAQGVKEAYNAAIEEADMQYGKENWQGAKSAYENAAEIKPDEEYPKTQIEDIDAKIAAAEAAEKAAREKEAREEFDALIKDGDKDFKRERYEDALANYQSALELMPGSELAMEKIGDVNEILGELDAEAEAERKYEALIQKGDELFDNEDYEMARLKFLDAKELKPNEEYPPRRITEIDIRLEKQRLAEQQAEAEALDAEYNAVLKRGDDLLLEEKYDEAIDAYNEALELKPEETYPQGQIEKIALLREELAAKKANEKRQSKASEAGKESASRKNESLSNVNTNSEEQAEQFMRDARDAQKQEKYARIRKEKEQYAENSRSYRENAEEMREENREHLESFRTGRKNQHQESVDQRKEQVQNSVNYKKALLDNSGVKAQTEAVHRKEAYENIVQQEENRSEWISDRQEIHQEKVEEEVALKQEQLEQMQEWSETSKADRKKLNKKIQEDAAQRYSENKAAIELRNERAKEFTERKNEISEIRSERAEQNMTQIREEAEKIQTRQENYATKMSDKNQDKVESSARQIEQRKEKYNSSLEDVKEIADKRREEYVEKNESIQINQPKDYDEYYRSELAENYPQGVSEESSTMGNKVIITRIVVKGNRGDEYKKVLDKAGNYYFKNGQSISENTWNRETIEAFTRAKD